MLALVIAGLILQASPSASSSPASAPSQSPSPTPSMPKVIDAPPGWEFQPQLSGGGLNARINLLAYYLGPSAEGFRPILNVISDPLADPNQTVAQRAKETAGYFSAHGSKVGANHAERVCRGTLDGWYIESQQSFEGKELSLVQTMAVAGGHEYVATYTREAGTTADPAAVHALDTLCPSSAAP